MSRFAIIPMSSGRGTRGTSYAVWEYDLTKPRVQRRDLPQGEVVRLVGSYRNASEAILVVRQLEGKR
jgi:hypothetical protein